VVDLLRDHRAADDLLDDVHSEKARSELNLNLIQKSSLFDV
jgi:hypothetical protein